MNSIEFMRIPDPARGVLAPRRRLKYNRCLQSREARLLKHYNVLSMVVVLLVGAWAIFVFHQKSRRFPDSRLRDLLRYLIFYNVIELEVFSAGLFRQQFDAPAIGELFFLVQGRRLAVPDAADPGPVCLSI